MTARDYATTTHSNAAGTHGDSGHPEPGSRQPNGPDRHRSGPFVLASVRRGQLVEGGSVIGGSVDGGGLVVDPPVQCEIVTTALLCTGPV